MGWPGRLGVVLLCGVFATWVIALFVGYDVVADVNPALGGTSSSSAHW